MTTPRTIGDVIQHGIKQLQGSTGTPRQDAQTILSNVIGKPREFVIAHTEDVLDEVQAHTFDKLITLRTHGMPLAYIVGRRAFYDRDFVVNPQVLIPRPETEHIVEETIDWARDRGAVQIIDVGTGSGVIGLTIAAKLPQALVYAIDVSSAALELAQENAQRLTNVRIVQADLLAPFGGTFDVICANLPYIATSDMSILDVAKFEPHVALDGGDDGLFLIRKLLQQAPARLAKPGLLLMEHGADQGPAVAALAQAAFPAAQVRIIQDYARLDRVVRVEQ